MPEQDDLLDLLRATAKTEAEEWGAGNEELLLAAIEEIERLRAKLKAREEKDPADFV